MRIITPATLPEPNAILARPPVMDELLAAHPASHLFNVVVTNGSFNKVSLSVAVRDPAQNRHGEFQGALGLVVDLAARLAGAGLIGPCELLEYEMHYHSGFTLETLSIDVDIQSAAPGYAICHCAVKSGDADERLVASAQGTLVKQSSLGLT